MQKTATTFDHVPDWSWISTTNLNQSNRSQKSENGWREQLNQSFKRLFDADASFVRPSARRPSVVQVSSIFFYLVALMASGVLSSPERAGEWAGCWATGRAAGQRSPVSALTPVFFLGSFSNLAKTSIALGSQRSSIREVPNWIWA